MNTVSDMMTFMFIPLGLLIIWMFIYISNGNIYKSKFVRQFLGGTWYKVEIKTLMYTKIVWKRGEYRTYGEKLLKVEFPHVIFQATRDIVVSFVLAFIFVFISIQYYFSKFEVFMKTLFFIFFFGLISCSKEVPVEPKKYHTVTVEVLGNTPKHIDIQGVISTDAIADFKHDYTLTITNRNVFVTVSSDVIIKDDIIIKLDGEEVAARLSDCMYKTIYLHYEIE